MNSILTQALQPLRPLLAASVPRPRVSDVNGVLHGLGGSRITSGISPPVSSSLTSFSLLFSSSPAARETAATGVKAPEIDWKTNEWKDGDLVPRVLRRRRMALERDRIKLQKLLDTKGPQGLLRPNREEQLMERERERKIREMETQGRVMPGSMKGQQMIKEHIEKFAEDRLKSAERRARNKLDNAFNSLDFDLLVHTRRKAKWDKKQDKYARKREEKKTRYDLAALEAAGLDGDDWGTAEPQESEMGPKEMRVLGDMVERKWVGKNLGKGKSEDKS